MGYLFQSYALFPNMTVAQNILCGLCREPDRGKKKALLQDAVAMMRLEGLERLRPAQLSGGQAQRAALARILVSRPNLLMLDEPFSALDSHLRDQLQLQTKALLAQFGKPVLLVTHSRDEAYRLCGQIAVVDQGRFLVLKETKALFADPGSVQAARLTGCKNIAEARKTGDYELEVPAWGVRLRTAQPGGRRSPRRGHPGPLLQLQGHTEPLPRPLYRRDGGALRGHPPVPVCGAGPRRPRPVVAHPQGPPASGPAGGIRRGSRQRPAPLRLRAGVIL